jgi:anti-sigma factor RsiW
MVRHTSGQRPRSKIAKITCQQITALILDYLTGELNAETALAFKAHLRKCPDCIAFLSTYQKTVHAARSLRHESIPLQMRRRIRQFLRERIKGVAA